MKNIILIICVSLFSCVADQSSSTDRDLRECVNKKVTLEFFNTIQQGKTSVSFHDFKQKFKFFHLVYIQDGCASCLSKLSEWDELLTNISSETNYTILLVIKSHSYESYITQVQYFKQVANEFYYVMDPNDKLLKSNKDIPRWIIDAGILIDAENKIKMVGAPWLNEDMTELFYKTVNSEQ